MKPTLLIILLTGQSLFLSGIRRAVVHAATAGSRQAKPDGGFGSGPPGDEDPRARMTEVFPHLIQGFLTRLTGKALPGQKLEAPSRIFLLVRTLLIWVCGLGLGIVVASRPGTWTLMVAAWILAIHGARTIQLDLIHEAAHDALFGSKGVRQVRLNDFWGHLLSILVAATFFGAYKPRHRSGHHQRNKTSTEADPTVVDLMSVGLKPGMPVLVLWVVLCCQLLSPYFHLHRLWLRVSSYFENTPHRYKFFILAWWGVLFGFAAIVGGWKAVAFGLFVPMVPLYQISQILRLCVEHGWPSDGSTTTTTEYAELTEAVFLGAMPPPANATLLSKLVQSPVFILKMIGATVARVTCLVGTTPVHDWHHLNPESLIWNAAFTARQEDKELRENRGHRVYTERWGLLYSIHKAFRNLSQMPRMKDRS